MPQMGVSVAEGTIVEWRKRPGDWVEADEPVCDVTTDKVDVEIPSPASGRLERILVEPGSHRPVGTLLAEIDAEAKPGEAHPEEHRQGARPRRRTPPGPGPARRQRRGGSVRFLLAGGAADRRQAPRRPLPGRGHRDRRTRRKKDVLAYIESEEGAPLGGLRPSPCCTSSPPTNARRPGARRPRELVEELAPGRREPMSPMRQAIARHMVESRRTAAHCTTIVEADFSRVAARRRSSASRCGAAASTSPTWRSWPGRPSRRSRSIRSSTPPWTASEIVYHDDVNLGIAVALEDGLIVPVIRQAQRLSLEGMAAAIADLAERARAKRLEPDEVHGGTFTITNPGQFGAVLATPIINQPQVAILDLEAIVKRPVVIEGPEGDSIAIRPMTYLCMSWDHRALDGADAARFLGSVKDRLESWEVSR